MNCQDFKTGLHDKNQNSTAESETALRHMAACQRCQKLSARDALVEDRIRKSLIQLDPPPDLMSRIKLDSGSSEDKQAASISRWKIIAPVLAMAAAVIIFFINPFSGQIRNLDDFSTFVIATHLNPNLKMAFSKDDVADVSNWFAKRLVFPVVVPDLSGQGFKLIGGRKWIVGRKDAAYLYYEKEGKKASVFVINPDDLDFNLAPHKTYRVTEGEYQIQIWKEKNLRYALVEKS
jgi:anti-sigma factor RsiW